MDRPTDRSHRRAVTRITFDLYERNRVTGVQFAPRRQDPPRRRGIRVVALPGRDPHPQVLCNPVSATGPELQRHASGGAASARAVQNLQTIPDSTVSGISNTLPPRNNGLSDLLLESEPSIEPQTCRLSSRISVVECGDPGQIRWCRVRLDMSSAVVRPKRPRPYLSDRPRPRPTPGQIEANSCSTR